MPQAETPVDPSFHYPGLFTQANKTGQIIFELDHMHESMVEVLGLCIWFDSDPYEL
jgi:hypothetical protein